MKFNQEEQERIDSLKYFAQSWGKYVILLICCLFLIYTINTFWNAHQEHLAKESGKLYQDINTALSKNDDTTVYAITNHLEKDYKTSQYTAMSSMLAAKVAKSNGKDAVAERYLDFTIKNAKDSSLVDIARLRLADIYIDEKQFQKILPLLAQKHNKSFDALYYSKRGDMHVAQGNFKEASLSYKTALEMAGDNMEVQNMIQMRSAVLGNTQ